MNVLKTARRVAMWSGPRNISTALMRAWGNRPDTIVCDEPLYAYYLKETGYTHHPVYDKILATHETDGRRVVQWLTGPLPEGKQIFYQKQMAHHLLDELPLAWTDELTHAFLIRDPREMLLSLLKVLPDATVAETGLPQQVKLFERVRQQTETVPPVLDAKDVLLDPEGMLQQLCQRIDIPFDECMLRWQPGIHETDGVWAEHWYGNVAESTGFAPYQPRTGELPPRHHQLLSDCQTLYDKLASYKLKPKLQDL